ncbi:MAG: SCP2 sterol-binding domain-containing protein [Acidimicrobiia bacterium]|nr:SCP2 sterol-binding domain-containing protein [Acidimicrobiia bacterium]
MKFLTKEWLEALTAALEGHEGFKSAIASTELTLQFEVPDAPEGTEGTYLITISGGSVRATPGPGENPEVTIINNYETAVAISKGELDTQQAFFANKIKISGSMAALMRNMAALGQFAKATAGMEVEY